MLLLWLELLGSSARGSGQTLPGACSLATQQRLLQKKATDEKKDAAKGVAVTMKKPEVCCGQSAIALAVANAEILLILIVVTCWLLNFGS